QSLQLIKIENDILSLPKDMAFNEKEEFIIEQLSILGNERDNLKVLAEINRSLKGNISQDIRRSYIEDMIDVLEQHIKVIEETTPQISYLPSLHENLEQLQFQLGLFIKHDANKDQPVVHSELQGRKVLPISTYDDIQF